MVYRDGTRVRSRVLTLNPVDRRMYERLGRRKLVDCCVTLTSALYDLEEKVWKLEHSERYDPYPIVLRGQARR